MSYMGYGGSAILWRSRARPPLSTVTSLAAVPATLVKMFCSGDAIYGVGGVVTAGLAYYMPYLWRFGFVPTLMGLEVTTLQAGATFRLALHAMNADYSVGAQLALLTGLDAATTGLKTGAIAPAAWSGPGYYWVAFETDTASVQVKTLSSNTPSLFGRPSGSNYVGYTQTQTYATSLPATPPALTAFGLGVSQPCILLGLS